MTANVIHTSHPEDSIKKAAEKMKQAHVGCLIVINRGRLSGIVTERDIVQRAVAEGKSLLKTQVSQIMSKPVIRARPDTTIFEAARLMLRNKIRRLPITQGRRVVGILTTTDYAKYMARSSRNPLFAAASRAEYQTIFE
jgi:CBS domain-containing protein